MVFIWENSFLFQVKLKDSLVSSLDFVKSKDVELAWVDGEIAMEKDVDKMVVKEDRLKEEDEDMKGE